MRSMLLVLLCLPACRAEPLEPDPSRLHLPSDFEAEDIFLEGPEPFVEGDERLTFGVFYEGGYSEIVPIDGIQVHYYIYETSPGGPLTYQQVQDKDRVEGLFADRILHNGQAWWGGGLHFTTARDLSAWETLHLSLKSSAEAFSEVEIGMGSSGRSVTVKASDYGYFADGNWHSLQIPMSDFAELGVDLEALTDAVVLGGGAGQSGEALKVDAVFMTR
jgi:hypothetical protein